MPYSDLQSSLLNQAYIVAYEAVLTANSSFTLTLQQSAQTALRTVKFLTAFVQMKAGNTYTLVQSWAGTDATAAGSTSVIVPQVLPPVIPTGGLQNIQNAKVTAYGGSNVGAGSQIGNPTYGTSPLLFDLTYMGLAQYAGGNNYSMTITNTGAGSDTGLIQIVFYEQ